MFNLIKEDNIGAGPVDCIAELDNMNTINALKTAMESGGCEVTLIEDDKNAPMRLREVRPDIVFNIVEGTHGESRESYIPSLLETLDIPYTGSGPLTLAICLNKARTKEILLHNGIMTPRFQVFHTSDEKINPKLRYPKIVKLLAEGSSMGLDNEKSIVENDAKLRERVEYLHDTYKRPAIAEEFIEGREFTIPIIGNNPPMTLPIIETKFMDGQRIVTFEPDEPVVPMIKCVVDGYKPKKNKTMSQVPADIDENTAERLRNTALKVYKTLGCRDWCRMEMRLDKDGNIFVLELNPIAGIDPSYWFPKSARAAGIEYNQLIIRILDYALQRYGIAR